MVLPGSDPQDPDPLGPNLQQVVFKRQIPCWRCSPTLCAPSASDKSTTTFAFIGSPPFGMVNTNPIAHARTTVASLTPKVEPSVTTGISWPDARTNLDTTFMSAQVVETSLMERKNAVSCRRHHPRTPLIADQWYKELDALLLLGRYNKIPLLIRKGALTGILQIAKTFAPLNKESTELLAHIFFDIIKSEFDKGRYLGPFSHEELEHKIRPFQSYPLSGPLYPIALNVI